jgi:hypothetical protein
MGRAWSTLMTGRRLNEHDLPPGELIQLERPALIDKP